MSCKGFRWSCWGLALSLAGSVATAADVELTGARGPVRGELHEVSDLQLECRWIAPGTFAMGSPSDEMGRDRAEGPQTLVTLSEGFWLGKTEVTQAQYEAVVGSNPSHFKAVGDNAPVERVSWLEAMEFCRLLTERERAAGRLPEELAFTLPTEAQWEYASRAGATTFDPATVDTVAWYDANAGETVHPVAQKEPNAGGLYDMSGNVLEWCRDWYGPYPGGRQKDPAGPADGHFRIARGGSWRTGPAVCRPAARAGGSPGRQDYTIGFRVALCAAPHAAAH